MQHLSADDMPNRGTSLPDEARCSFCGFWEIGHPDVDRILTWREENEGYAPGWLHNQAKCRCQDNAARDASEAILRQAQANLPHPLGPRTFESLRKVEGLADALQGAQRFAALEGAPCLVIVGQTGMGKSHLLEAIGRHVLGTTGWSVRYETASAFLARLRETFTDDRESVASVVDWYQRRRVLLLDDLGTRAERDWAIQELTDLVDERIRMGWWLAVATNLGREEMAAALGERMASRLYQANEALGEVLRVTLTCPDYRMGP